MARHRQTSAMQRWLLHPVWPYLGAVGITCWHQFGAGHIERTLYLVSGVDSGFSIILAVPVLLGILLQLVGRRFWTWPFLYLLALWLVPLGIEGDFVDRSITLANAAIVLLIIGLTESTGLAMGRLLSRILGLAFFVLCGGWMLYIASRSAEASTNSWYLGVLTVGGLLFILQAVFQLSKYVRKRLEDQAHPSHEPVAHAKKMLPGDRPTWTIRVDTPGKGLPSQKQLERNDHPD